MMRTALALACSLSLPLLAEPALGAQPQTWTIDPVHSTAQFTALHFGIVPVIGTIPITDASVALDPGTQIPVAMSARLDATKIDTHNDTRDNDLRSAHYFNAESTPEIRFVSTKVEGHDPKHFTVTGNLTMHGQTHPIVLDAQVVGAGKSPKGRSIIAYAANATVDRTQWGMTYGPLIVSNNVTISLNVEADGP